MRRRELLKGIPLLMTPALARADTRPLRFIPNANLSAIDPIWTTALVAQEHGYLINELDAGRLEGGTDGLRPGHFVGRGSQRVRTVQGLWSGRSDSSNRNRATSFRLLDHDLWIERNEEANHTRLLASAEAVFA